MTDLKFYLLDKIKSAPPTNHIREIDLWNSGFAHPSIIQDAIEDLKHSKYIESPFGSDKLTTTRLGNKAFEDATYERKQEAKQERQQSFDNKISVASVLVPAITFVLGVIVEHYTQIASILIAFFKSLS